MTSPSNDRAVERAALADSVRRLLAEAGLPRKGYGEPPDRDLWRKLADLGVVAALAPESADGLGLSLADVGGVLKELGRACYSGPFVASAVGATTLLSAIGDTDLLGKVVAGDVIATVVDGDVVDSGTLADVLLIVDGDAVRMTEDFTATDAPTIDGSRSLATISYADAQPLAQSAADAIAAMRDHVMAAWLADGLGAAQAVFDLAMAHAQTRVQFGVPIGSFQSVQHLLVDAYATLQAGRLSVENALAGADGEPDDFHRAVTMAAAWCCDGFFEIAATGIAVLGGIGFTWEHDAHLYYKRLLSLQATRGGSAAALEELARLTV
jgi:alkylation response protein AidB-like acyl-CoA dehydrogenase